jgi:hypothetical protein
MPLDIDDRDRLVGEDAGEFQSQLEIFQGGHARLSPWEIKEKVWTL